MANEADDDTPPDNFYAALATAQARDELRKRLDALFERNSMKAAIGLRVLDGRFDYQHDDYQLIALQTKDALSRIGAEAEQATLDSAATEGPRSR